MSSSKKPVDQETQDSGAGWFAKWKAGMGPDQLTPAEKRQFNTEVNWVARADREDLPGPRRIEVFDDPFVE